MMTADDIERLLRLQAAAYEFLLWIDRRSRTEQDLLSAQNLEKWHSDVTCERWIRDIYGMIPTGIRPAPEDVPGFAHLFSSFLETSFRIVDNAPVRSVDDWGEESRWVPGGRRRLMAGSPGGKKSTKAKERLRDSARTLCRIALEELAVENELFPSRADVDFLVRDPALTRALILWTYVHELNRRAHFASQGEAVRTLWLAMEKQEREHLTVPRVIEARDSLLADLRHRLATPT